METPIQETEPVNKYKSGKIYKVVCNNTGKTYYGSTYGSIAKKKGRHKSNYHNEYLKGKRGFVSVYDIIKEGNYDIFLVENYPCETKEELHARERWYIENNECINIMWKPKKIETEIVN